MKTVHDLNKAENSVQQKKAAWNRVNQLKKFERKKVYAKIVKQKTGLNISAGTKPEERK